MPARRVYVEDDRRRVRGKSDRGLPERGRTMTSDRERSYAQLAHQVLETYECSPIEGRTLADGVVFLIGKLDGYRESLRQLADEGLSPW